jgi:hypothetical protein
MTAMQEAGSGFGPPGAAAARLLLLAAAVTRPGGLVHIIGMPGGLMEVNPGSEIAPFRANLTEWTAVEAPEELAGLADSNRNILPGGHGRDEVARAGARPAFAERSTSRQLSG